VKPFSELELLASFPYDNVSPVLVDVGAHHGGFSRRFAEMGWRVIAFEPEPTNREAFGKNLARFPRAVCVAKAVTDSGGETVPFYVSDEHYGIHSLKPFHATHRKVCMVETVRLDDALAELLVPEVTLLKIDAEGADFPALKGMDLSLCIPEMVMVEFMDQRSRPNFGYSHHDVAAYMQERGFVAYVSEWAPIKEYGREGDAGEPHEWLRCVPYPLCHEPDWGNLIFVPEARADIFAAALKSYLGSLGGDAEGGRLKSGLERLPVGGMMLRLLRTLFR